MRAVFAGVGTLFLRRVCIPHALRRLMPAIASARGEFRMRPVVSPALPAAAATSAAAIMRGLLGGLFLALVMLAGCKSLPVAPPVPSEPWEVRRAALQARDSFDLKGRIAVAAADDGFQGKLRWEQNGARSQLALDGPLGVGGVRIRSDGESLSVENSKGEQLDSEAARREIEAKLGFEPPLASLRYWVLGVPDPSSPADEQLDESKRLASLSQDGWQIDYGGYTDVGGEALPSKVTLKRENVRVRLVVDGWGT